MNDIQKRFALFLIGCIGLRSLFVYVAWKVPVTYLPYLGAAALLPAIGFLWIWASGSRQTGAEVFGEHIWWNNLRPLHAALYIAFAIGAFLQHRNAWMFLAADVVVGLTSFTAHHLAAGTFKQLLI
jgi:hypothetical protein